MKLYNIAVSAAQNFASTSKRKGASREFARVPNGELAALLPGEPGRGVVRCMLRVDLPFTEYFFLRWGWGERLIFLLDASSGFAIFPVSSKFSMLRAKCDIGQKRNGDEERRARAAGFGFTSQIYNFTLFTPLRIVSCLIPILLWF